MKRTPWDNAVSPVPVYCDRLSLKVCAVLVRMRVIGVSGERVRSVQVLDPVSGKIWHRLLRAAMKLIRVNVEQAQFFAGHLKSATGEAASIAAVRWAEDTFVEAADRVVESSSFLSDLNIAWGRNTIQLHLAKKLWISMLDSGRRIFVASALARDTGAGKAVMLVVRPHDFPSSYLSNLCCNIEVRFYSPGFGLSRAGWFYLLLWMMRSHSMELKWRIEAQAQRFLSRRRPFGIEDNGSTSVLLIQESEVSLDRSYRTQPHWLFETEGRTPFQTYILERSFPATSPMDNGCLKDQGIQMVSQKDMTLARHHHPPLPVQRRLSRDLRRCILKSLLGRSGPQTAAAAVISRLFFTATRMADFCWQANVKVFMTGETYHTEVDAVQLLGPELGIHTLLYQFPNLGNCGPHSLTNSDTMLMFSALHHRHYTKDEIRPGSFIDLGYPYDTSFQLVRERAQNCRKQLEKAGAKFIICYFPENATHVPYGVIAPKDDIRDLLTLMRMVLDDPSIGLVLKTKLMGNSLRLPDEILAVRESVEATGRYVELMYGTHRNIVFPAEAALCSDLAIGHAAGATAVLEAALTGARGILLNPYGISGGNDALYAQADIIYPSLEEALEAIAAFRANAPERQSLGDWSLIIDQFDPIRDGRAGHRMRATLEQAIMGAGASE